MSRDNWTPRPFIDVYSCHRCGTSREMTAAQADQHGWDWFTGYLPDRVTFCPGCRNSPEATALRAKSASGANEEKRP